ncbi:MAG: hypothetical protein JXR68_12075 [Bacteroidales bacterium]|nr:hypothetical protein [Bacteroidales bacterium]
MLKGIIEDKALKSTDLSDIPKYTTDPNKIVKVRADGLGFVYSTHGINDVIANSGTLPRDQIMAINLSNQVYFIQGISKTIQFTDNELRQHTFIFTNGILTGHTIL